MKRDEMPAMGRLFGEQDLPLFSGTAPAGVVEEFHPAEVVRVEQSELFAEQEQDQRPADGPPAVDPYPVPPAHQLNIVALPDGELYLESFDASTLYRFDGTPVKNGVALEKYERMRDIVGQVPTLYDWQKEPGRYVRGGTWAAVLVKAEGAGPYWMGGDLNYISSFVAENRLISVSRSLFAGRHFARGFAEELGGVAV
jgi:hypothetical protein